MFPSIQAVVANVMSINSNDFKPDLKMCNLAKKPCVVMFAWSITKPKKGDNSTNHSKRQFDI